jgi:hypothetical protein
MSEQADPERNLDEKIPAGRKRIVFRLVGFALLLLALILAIYGVVAYSAWQRGQIISTENEQQALDSEMRNQFNLASEEIDSANFSIAIRRLEWVLAQNDAYPGAQDLLEQARLNQSLLLTPSPLPTLTSTPVTEVEPTGPDPGDEFSAIENLFERQLWPETLETLLEFQIKFPNYKRQETNQMLFTTYIRFGEEQLSGDQVESGLYFFSQAERLGDLPLEIEDQRTWAEIYLLGIGYYGVDWETSVYYFRDLCAAAPFFQNACSLLREALIAYGEQYATALDWCPAYELFVEAQGLRRDEELAARADLSFEQCSLATPTVTPTLEGDLSVEETPTPTSD